MRLVELAEELGIPAEDALEILMHHPTQFLCPGNELHSLYGMRVLAHRVNEAREVLLKERAQEVIDHVQEHGTEDLQRKAAERWIDYGDGVEDDD